MDGDIRQAKAPEEADFNGSVSEAKTLSDKDGCAGWAFQRC